MKKYNILFKYENKDKIRVNFFEETNVQKLKVLRPIVVLVSSKFQDGFIEAKIPYNGIEDEKNYCRAYFLSMALNAAVHGMKRLKHKKRKR